MMPALFRLPEIPDIGT